ncbi:MAG: hypothetical protein NVSMB51_21500 [Solirubrobacteraceae bacterium]
MDERADNHRYVRQLRLPSGRRIEVVYFDRPGEQADHEPTQCGTCHSTLVYPICWEGAGVSHWRVTLRCPNCEWCGTTVLGEADVERLDLRMQSGAEEMLERLRLLELEQMLEDTERFVEALAEDHILPTDF